MQPTPDSRVCIDCRNVVGQGETCHRVTDLQRPEGREALLTEVWGPPSLRRKLRGVAAAGGSGAAAGGLFEGCGCLADCGLSAIDGPVLAMLACVGAFVLVYLLVAWIIRRVRSRRDRPRPYGALRHPPVLHGRRHRGVVAPDAPTVTSVSGEQAVAHALHLRCKRFLRSDRMLVDSVSAGFTLRLPDGAEVRVPAGRVRLEGPRRRERAVGGDRVQDHLARLDPLRKSLDAIDELEPIPFEQASELVLLPGEAVELIGQLEPMVDVQAPAAAYRDSASTVLVPRSGFGLRLVGAG